MFRDLRLVTTKYMKYRAKIFIDVEFNTEDDPRAHIIRELNAILPIHYDFSLANIAHTSRGLKVLGEFAPDQVFPFVGPERREYKINGASYTVRMDSHRYSVFVENRTCVACGLEGTKFLLELPSDSSQPHFNFYAVEHGQLVLMTKDHIRSRAHAGQDILNNYQTMCGVCNCLKGSHRLSIEAVIKLREIYNSCRRGSTKRQLAKRLHKARRALALPPEPGERADYLNKMKGNKLALIKAVPSLVVNTKIIVCFDDSHHLIALTEAHYLARFALGNVAVVILPGTVVQPTGEVRLRKVGVTSQSGQVFIYHGLLSLATT